MGTRSRRPSVSAGGRQFSSETEKPASCCPEPAARSSVVVGSLDSSHRRAFLPCMFASGARCQIPRTVSLPESGNPRSLTTPCPPTRPCPPSCSPSWWPPRRRTRTPRLAAVRRAHLRPRPVTSPASVRCGHVPELPRAASRSTRVRTVVALCSRRNSSSSPGAGVSLPSCAPGAVTSSSSFPASNASTVGPDPP
jgi:hypothetical protein